MISLKKKRKKKFNEITSGRRWVDRGLLGCGPGNVKVSVCPGCADPTENVKVSVCPDPSAEGNKRHVIDMCDRSATTIYPTVTGR